MLSLLCIATALANPGDLDTSFAGTGKLRTGFGGGDDRAYAVAVQADGRLVMAGMSGLLSYNGSFSLVRLDTNNVLDASFGEGGKVLTPVSSEGLPFSDARVNAVRIQADGKILAGGYAYTGTNYPTFTVVRYHPNGSLDTTFGTNGTGIVYTDFGQPSTIRAMVIQGTARSSSQAIPIILPMLAKVAWRWRVTKPTARWTPRLAPAANRSPRE